jgi:hypothetical protein
MSDPRQSFSLPAKSKEKRFLSQEMTPRRIALHARSNKKRYFLRAMTSGRLTAARFADALAARGRYHFTTEEVVTALGGSLVSARAALRRLGDLEDAALGRHGARMPRARRAAQISAARRRRGAPLLTGRQVLFLASVFCSSLASFRRASKCVRASESSWRRSGICAAGISLLSIVLIQLP